MVKKPAGERGRHIEERPETIVRKSASAGADDDRRIVDLPVFANIQERGNKLSLGKITRRSENDNGGFLAFHGFSYKPVYC